jgi:hypothetical protein
MVRYFYAFTPLFLVGTLCILALPWLGLIALFVVALVVVPALACAIFFVPYVVVRAICRGLQGESRAIPLTVAAPSPPTLQAAFRKGLAS